MPNTHLWPLDGRNLGGSLSRFSLHTQRGIRSCHSLSLVLSSRLPFFSLSHGTGLCCIILFSPVFLHLHTTHTEVSLSLSLHSTPPSFSGSVSTHSSLSPSIWTRPNSTRSTQIPPLSIVLSRLSHGNRRRNETKRNNNETRTKTKRRGSLCVSLFPTLFSLSRIEVSSGQHIVQVTSQVFEVTSCVSMASNSASAAIARNFFQTFDVKRQQLVQ